MLVENRPARWAVADISYVREQYPTRTAAQIADDLGVSPARVASLIAYRGWRKNGDDREMRKPVRPEPAICPALGRGTRGERHPAGVVAAPGPQKPATARISAPPDLLQFIVGMSEREAARELGLSKGSIRRLRDGYWPNDSRRLMAAWERYKATRSQIAGSWFIRRVYAGGLVRHAGQAYTATNLAARTGQLLAVTRAADGGLLAQTLDIPAERLSLWLAQGAPA